MDLFTFIKQIFNKKLHFFALRLLFQEIILLSESLL